MIDKVRIVQKVGQSEYFSDQRVTLLYTCIHNMTKVKLIPRVWIFYAEMTFVNYYDFSRPVWIDRPIGLTMNSQ